MVWAITAITLALIFYTSGVWAEKRHGSLEVWHIVVFWCGFLFDSIGTTLMGRLSQTPLTVNFHSVTGLLAILLMLAHAVWATNTLAKGSEEQKSKFHRFSIFVWTVWLIPYFSGMLLGMMR